MADEQVEREVSSLVLALGGAVASPSDAVKSITHTVIGAIQGRGLQHLSESLRLLQEKGSVDPSYIDNPWAGKQFTAVLRELNRKDIDESRLEALINVFLNSAKGRSENAEAFRMIEIMKIISELEAIDLYILSAINDLRLEANGSMNGLQYDSSASSWMALILKVTELEMMEVVSATEQKLIDKRLLTDRNHGDRSGIEVNSNYRLTEFGCRVCNYMKNPLD